MIDPYCGGTIEHLSGYPKGEICWKAIYDAERTLRYIITSKSAREYYTLWEVTTAGKCVRIARGATPLIVEQKNNDYE